MLVLTAFVALPYFTSAQTAKSCDRDWVDLVNYDVPADRVYHIGCVEEEWDYQPTGKNLVTGSDITEFSDEAVWLWGNRIDRIGSKYIKTLYREFTDECFTEQKARGPKWKHLGALGPAIRAVQGETIKIFYKNDCTIPTSMHPHGLLYDKTSEGAPYDDGSLDGDIIEPGSHWIYIWKARADSVDDTVSSKMWLYHSHVDEVTDIHSGLMGPIIVTRAGTERGPNWLMPNDLVREYVTFFVLYDENNTPLFEKSMEKYLDTPLEGQDLNDKDFVESNLMHSINGYLFGVPDGLNCTCGERIRWYTASFGNEKDGPHSPHWHGNVLTTAEGIKTDAVVLIPGTTADATMNVDARGDWLYHCHVFDHIEAGMITTYEVKDRTASTTDDPNQGILE